LKNLNRIDSTHDIHLTPIHFRALKDVMDMTNLPFWRQMAPFACPQEFFSSQTEPFLLVRY